MVVVIGTLMGIRRLEQRKEPVPVKQGEVGIRIGRWMPAKQMVVMLTDLARPVVMANVVIVGLRQRHMNHAKNHDPDSRGFATQTGDHLRRAVTWKLGFLCSLVGGDPVASLARCRPQPARCRANHSLLWTRTPVRSSRRVRGIGHQLSLSGLAAPGAAGGCRFGLGLDLL